MATTQDKFDGSADHCHGFLRQYDNLFAHQPEVYREVTKCIFVLSLLMGRSWASALWNSDTQVKYSFTYFSGLIRKVFEYQTGGQDILVQLLELCQGTDSATDYTVKIPHPGCPERLE